MSNPGSERLHVGLRVIRKFRPPFVLGPATRPTAIEFRRDGGDERSRGGEDGERGPQTRPDVRVGARWSGTTSIHERSEAGWSE